MMAAADMAGKPEAENPCCRAWKEKYSKLEQKRFALRQAVNILTPQIDAIQAENATLKKEYEEEQARADNEKEGRLKESIARVSLENEISTLKSEIASLQKKARTSSLDRDQEVRLLQDRVSEREKEVNHLKELLEEEKKRADIKRKDDEKYRIQLEVLKKEADEAKSKLAAETLNLEQANKKLEAEKRKAIKERKHADSEMAKAERQRKLAEANNGKKVVEEKCRAENLSQQLEESRQRLEALQKEMHNVWSSRNLAPPVGQADNKLSPESTKTENRLQVDEPKLAFDLLKESNKKFEVEKQNAIREKKRAESERVKAEEQKKVAEVNWKKAIEEKLRADQLSQQLQEARRTIEELQKKMHELLSSRKLVEGSAVSPIKTITSENANLKFLKKQLKLEKMQVKQAKQVAKLEKSRNRILQQELGCLKLEFDQFARRLDLLNKSFSPSSEGIDDLEKIEYMQRLNMKKKKHFSLEPSWAHLQSDNEVVRPSCMDASGPFRLSLRHSVPSLPTPGGNCAESISGINYKLECPLGCSNWKMIETSAINSSTASFSDGQLMGSQERGAFSVTTSAKLAKDNLNSEPTIPNLSGEVTKLRCSEKSAEVAENNVKIPDSNDFGRGCEHIRKRKGVLDSIESIEYLYSKGRKLHMQIEEKLLFLHSMLGRQQDNPLEEGRCLASNLQCIPHAKLDGLHKKRKVSHEEVMAKHFCDIDERKNNENVETEVHEDASNLETMGSFEDVVDGDYMKLLDLDNSADEERYRMALKMPLSPTLHKINFHGDEIIVNNSEALLEKWANEGLSTDKESLLLMQSFGVVDFEINSNKLKHDVLATSHNLLLHKNVGPACSFAVNGNGCSTTETEKTSSHQIWDSGLVVGMSNSPISRDEEVKFPFESELGSTHDIIPTYCVVFPNMRDCIIISRILGAVKTCIARCCLLSQTEWVVPKILLALKMEQNLLLMEKVCVFFTLLLLNLSLAAPRKFGKYLNGDSILCMDSFSRHMRAATSDAETRSMFEDFGFLDELLSLIEEFLIDGRVMVYNNTSSETVIRGESRIDFVLDGVNIKLLYEVASADQLVAGSIILASICAAVDQIGIICEASYNIFRRHASDASLVLTIVHVFAYLGGQKFFSLRNYALMMTVLKSLVLLLEGVNLSGDAASCPLFVSQVQTQFHPCTKCPFSEGAVSVDTATSFLIELLQNCDALGSTTIDVLKSCNSLNSRVLYDNFKSEQGLSHEGVHYVAVMNCDASCSLDKYDIPTTQSDSIVDMTLCRLSDILSLVELLACSMSWDWTSIKMVPQLLRILESCVLENFAAAIIVLLGQLGRLGVDAGGYEDKGVENLRCNLSVFFSRDATRKAGLPIQIATVTALLGLLPLDFETLVHRNVKIRATASQSVLADSVTKWFSLLSKEQQDLSLKLLQTTGAKKK